MTVRLETFVVLIGWCCERFVHSPGLAGRRKQELTVFKSGPAVCLRSRAAVCALVGGSPPPRSRIGARPFLARDCRPDAGASRWHHGDVLPCQPSRAGRCAAGGSWRCMSGSRCMSGRRGGVRSRAAEARQFGRRRGPMPGSTAGASGRRAHLPERGRMLSPAARAARRQPARRPWAGVVDRAG